MKKLCMYLLIIGLGFPVFAQEKESDNFYESNDLPAVVLKKAGDEFSVYYPDNSNPDSRVLKLKINLSAIKSRMIFMGLRNICYY